MDQKELSAIAHLKYIQNRVTYYIDFWCTFSKLVKLKKKKKSLVLCQKETNYLNSHFILFC